MEEVLAAKWTISKVKTELLEIARGLIADEVMTEEYAAKEILKVIEFIEKEDIMYLD